MTNSPQSSTPDKDLLNYAAEKVKRCRRGCISGMIKVGSIPLPPGYASFPPGYLACVLKGSGITESEMELLLRLARRHPDWINPALVDLDDPDVEPLEEIALSATERHLGIPPSYDD